eukprot:Seg2178.7 transcript_id=Seg2178.7/GoldUCD/mRNA.D3Y31 product="Chromatin accessibility complex protein 1" protein_id=Seg2178.7/GoldUCD/D3Y31
MADESPKENEAKLLKLPLARIKMIMKSSPDLGSVSQEGYFLIARAAELFAQYVAEEGLKAGKDKKELNYKGLANAVESNDSLDFLEDIIPQKITMKEYWDRTKKSESS